MKVIIASLALLVCACATQQTAPDPITTLFGLAPMPGTQSSTDCPGGEVAMRARFAGIQGIVCTDFASEGAADRAREFYTRAALQAGWGSVDALFGFAPPALSRRNDQRGCDEHLFFDRGARDGAPVRSTLNMMLVDDPGCRSSGQIGGRR